MSRNLKVAAFEVDVIASREGITAIYEVKCVAREMIRRSDISREMFDAASHYGSAKAANIHLAAEKLGITHVHLLTVALSLGDGRAYVVVYDA